MARKSKHAPTTEAMLRSRANTGAKPVGFTLLPAEIDLLDRAAERHGGRKAALMNILAADEAAAAGVASDAALAAEIARLSAILAERLTRSAPAAEAP